MGSPETKKRVSLGFTESFEDLTPTRFTVPPARPLQDTAAPAEEVRRVAQSAGFPSREAISLPSDSSTHQTRPNRAYRTGRSVQLNMKVRPIDRDAFYQLCTEQSWVQGYTFQRAIEALRREVASAGTSGQSRVKEA